MKKYYQINQFINALEVRLIGPDNKQVGIVSKFEALKMAREAELDLVLITQHAKPPIAKIIDFKKFKYQEQRKDRASRKGVHKVDTKQIIYTPYVAEHDFQVGVRKAQRWLKEGNSVKVIIKFVGRQITHKEFGYNLINKFAKTVEEAAKQEGVIKFERRTLTATFIPSAVKKLS